MSLCSDALVDLVEKQSAEASASALEQFKISADRNCRVLMAVAKGGSKEASAKAVTKGAMKPKGAFHRKLPLSPAMSKFLGVPEIARVDAVKKSGSTSKQTSSRECGLSHKSIIFVLDEFDLFAQGKQRLLYSLLDAMQTVSSQAVVIGVSCRLDADQLLEKRVRSRFSHRKLLFVPPSREDVRRLLEHILYLPKDIGLLSKYVAEFNSKIQDILNDKKFQEILDSILFIDGAINNLVQFLFRAVSSMSLESGLLSLENFKDSHLCYQRQPKTQILEGVSILELYILVCMNRLECKEQNSYNFNSVMKEYKAIHEAYKTSDNYRDSVCLRAFEHLLERELIGFVDNKGRNLSIEIQPVKLLISPHELYLGLKSRSSCPAILQKLFDHESFR